jgi:hypothetical protein
MTRAARRGRVGARGEWERRGRVRVWRSSAAGEGGCRGGGAKVARGPGVKGATRARARAHTHTHGSKETLGVKGAQASRCGSPSDGEVKEGCRGGADGVWG